MQAETAVGRTRQVWPFVVVAATYLYFFAGSYFGIYVAAVRASSTVLLAITFGAWAVLAWRFPSWRPSSVLMPGFLAALAALAISSLTSGNPRISLDYLSYSVILVGLYLLLRTLMTRPELRRRMTGLVTLLTGAMLVAYLVAVVLRWADWWDLVGELAIPPLRPSYEGLSYGNPGAVAVLAVLGYVVAVAHVGWGSRRAIAGLVLLGAMAGAVVLVTASRASWVAIGITSVVFAVVVIAYPPARAALRQRLQRPGLRVGAVALLGVAAVAALVIGPRVVDRFMTGGTQAERASFAAVSLRMAADRPVTGVGPGMWAPDRIRYTQPDETDYYIPHAHNLFTQTLSELGLVGMLAGLAVVVTGVAPLRRAVHDPDPERHRWTWATAVGTVYFVAHQQLDLFTNMPAVLFVYALPWAWIDATERRSLMGRSVPASIRRVAGAVAVVVVTVAIGWSWQAERAAVLMDDANDALSAGHAAEALALLERADAIDPAMPAHLLPLGLAQSEDAPTALATFTRLTEQTDLPTAWINRATVELQLGRQDEARESLGRALRLGDQQAGVLLAAGWLYEQLGELDASDQAYAGAITLEPRMAGDDFWSAPERVRRWTGIRGLVVNALGPDQTVNLVLSEARRSPDFAGLPLDPGPTSDVLPLVVDAWGDRPGAIENLYAWTRAHPADLLALGWAARVAARTGDLERARDYRDWADTVWGNAGDAGAEVKIDLTPPTDAPHTGLASPAWGIYTYRRPTPGDQLLPGLPHLVLTQ